ncbi:MAG: homoserine kinase [Thermoanaerobaculia bacterium]
MSKATVFAPGSIGNVGPGFDVLGLAIDGIGDIVTVELTDGDARVDSVTGLDAELVPLDPTKNVAVVAATAWLRAARIDKRPIVSIQKGLPVSGGLGGSAASSVGGAYGAALAANAVHSPEEVMFAALEAESTVAGRHLDNIAPCTMGGLTLVRSLDPLDVVPVRVPPQWALVLLTPKVRVQTKQARAILPELWPRSSWVQQMANTSSLVLAFTNEDGELLRRSLDDLYAEPLRANLIPNFREVKRAALHAGALGCSISGSGPTIFAITREPDEICAAAMSAAMRDVPCQVRVAQIARKGAHRI